MLFSCKITHSVISYLDRRGEDLESFNEKCDWPAEFLRDPSSWLEADKMEALLKFIESEYGQVDGTENLIAASGHHCKDLRSWGALDSVLRMVQAPKDLFAQPERFLSYFISPAPPIGEVCRETESVSFVLPVSEVQFPFVTSYLRAALEALPTYIAKPMGNVSWQDGRVTIAWSESQESLFDGNDPVDLQLKPELVRTIFQNMESSQKQLEEMKRDLLAREEEIQALRIELAKPRVLESAASDAPLAATLHDLYRLGDYLARGQQLITLLIGQGRQTPQVQEAMRRVDWEFVSFEGPKVVQKIVAGLQGLTELQASNGTVHAKTVHDKKDGRAGQPESRDRRERSPTSGRPLSQKSFDGVQKHF